MNWQCTIIHINIKNHFSRQKAPKKSSLLTSYLKIKWKEVIYAKFNLFGSLKVWSSAWWNQMMGTWNLSFHPLKKSLMNKFWKNSGRYYWRVLVLFAVEKSRDLCRESKKLFKMRILSQCKSGGRKSFCLQIFLFVSSQIPRQLDAGWASASLIRGFVENFGEFPSIEEL